jgi:CubicO group peptidase (beta-lactamase class C family)
VPGEKAGYNQASSWFVLGEVVRRVDGRGFDRYVREEIFEPLGMSDSWIGMAPDRFAAARDAGRLAPSWNTEREGSPSHHFEEESKVVSCSPGGNGWGPARELGRFYEMLLGGGRRIGLPAETAEVEILRPQTVSALTARHRVGMFDHTFQHEMDWGLGFILDGKRHGVETVPYGYGRRCSFRTFGHSGYRSTSAFADPEHNLAVALIPNGTPSAEAHERRTRAVLDALYEDLGLGGT